MGENPYRSIFDESYYFPQQQMSTQDFLRVAHHTLVTKPLAEKAKTAEQKFRDLDVREGDRIRLTQHQQKNGPDPSSLEGVVIGVKVKDGVSQVRIAGFGHTGATVGGQHVWFVGADYKVEVLHKSYRWNDEDRAIAAVLGYGDHSWKIMTEDSRERLRVQTRPRLERIRKALGVDAPS